jgi:hypothetical protein
VAAVRWWRAGVVGLFDSCEKGRHATIGYYPEGLVSGFVLDYEIKKKAEAFF